MFDAYFPQGRAPEGFELEDRLESERRSGADPEILISHLE